MEIETRKQGEVTIIRLSGPLDGSDDGELVESVSGCLAQPGSRVVLDLSAVPYVNSRGLSQLVHITAQANLQEGRVVLARLTPFVASVLQATQLDRFLAVARTIDAAMADEVRSKN